jgi:plasmid stability protein
MSKPLQIRDVPDDVHQTLRRKAKEAGLSLTAYARRVLERDAKQPALAEVLSRPGGRAPGVTAQELAKLVRSDRDAR